MRYAVGRRGEVLQQVRRAVAKSPQSAAEYKQVTVLFADLVHSMDLARAEAMG